MGKIEEQKALSIRFFAVALVAVVIIVTVWLVDKTMAVLIRREVFSPLLQIGVIPWDAFDPLIIMFRVTGLVLIALSMFLAYKGTFLYKDRSGYLLMRAFLLGVGIILCFSLSTFIGFFYLAAIFLWTPRRFTHWSARRLTAWRLIWLGGIWIWTLIEVAAGDRIPRFMMVPIKETLASLSLSPVILISLLMFPPAYILLPRLWVEIWTQRPKIESIWDIYSESRMGLVGLVLVLAIVVMGVFADFIAPYHWDEWYVGDVFERPSRSHLFGTNMRGMDIFSRVIYGSRISLIVGFIASAMAIVIGTSVGLLAGYYKGWLDTVLMRITDVFLSLPVLPFMLIFVALFGKGLQNIIIVIGMLGWTGTARMVRSETLSLRERPLTEAAHAIGASDSYIIIHHIIPNTLPLIFANVVLGVVNAVLSEAGLTFLGFGDIFGHPSWGIVLHFASMRGALILGMWWWIIPPGLLIMTLVLGFAFISHAFDRVVNPRLRERR